VTGTLGGSAAGLAVVEGRVPDLPAQLAGSLRGRYASPRPRLAEGRALALGGVTAMLDISDGLASDAVHLGRASGVMLELELAALPLAGGVAEVAAALGQDPAVFAAQGGEDFELCLCANPESRPAIEAALAACGTGTAMTWIGQVRGPEPSGAECAPGPMGALLRDIDGARPGLAGYEHSF
jgi:thiamine-monophosphate kinase